MTYDAAITGRQDTMRYKVQCLVFLKVALQSKKCQITNKKILVKYHSHTKGDSKTQNRHSSTAVEFSLQKMGPCYHLYSFLLNKH